MKPRYPVYVISKGRPGSCLTARYLLRDKVDLRVVIEPQEQEEYSKHIDPSLLLLLPFSNLGQGSTPARNWCWEHSIKAGAARHWILDDNIRGCRRLYRGKRIPCDARVAIAACEEFTDRYTNIGMSGLNYTMFVPNDTPTPYYLNCHVYSFILLRNDLPFRWRCRYNEDTDLNLQILSSGLCTVALNVFSCDKVATMKMKGGNTDQLYQGDGRLKMARSLERQWPYVVETRRKFKRPQHHIKKSWAGFDQKLIRRTDLDWNKIESGPNEFDIQLIQKSEIESQELQQIKQQWDQDHDHTTNRRPL